MHFISYAQNFEDVMLRRALQSVRAGFYIDVGAAHPVEMSVTKAFYDIGWNGINLEPAPHYFGILQAERPADINLQIAAAERIGAQLFYEIHETGLSTLDPDIAGGHIATGWTVWPREVEVTTLAEVCRQYAPPQIHFLKIDVEGAEAAVLAGADFKTFRPWIVLIEATKPLSSLAACDWEEIILGADYIFVWFDGLNRFYIARERHAELQGYFHLPPNSFDNFTVFTGELTTQLLKSDLLLQDNACTINLLENEILLRRRMQAASASLATVAQNTATATLNAVKEAAANAAVSAARLASENAALIDEIALRTAESNRQRLRSLLFQADTECLNRIINNLEWPNGPRAVKLVLPQARLIRWIMEIRWLRAGLRPLMRQIRRNRLPARSAPLQNMVVPSKIQATALIECVNTLTTTETGKPIALVKPARLPTKKPRHTVHQFHPGCAYGDAVTNSMLLTRDILRKLGYRSEIYVEHRDPLLSSEILLLENMPRHDEYVLIVLHSLGYDQTSRIAALPAPKLLMYHNITPAKLLSEVPELARLAVLGRAQLDFWRPHISAALAVSEYNALELRQHGFPEVAICPLLFDIDKLRARAEAAQKRNPADPYTILFIGRILESKGQAELVDAFGAFNLAYGRPCRLVLVGRTEGGGDQYLADLYQRIGEQGLRRCVILTGHVSDDELSDWLGRADLYVSLSQHEGFGVPLIEAMAFNVPVLAYAAGAIPFTMQKSGASPQILYTRDARTVAAAMLEIASDPTRSASIVGMQHENVERFALQYHIPALQYALLSAGASPPNSKGFDPLAEGLKFTIAGHFTGSYSLAGVNRALAMAMAEAAPGRVKILPVEGEPTADLGDVPEAERALLQTLMDVQLPEYAPSVVISQHYPVYVPAPADFSVAYFFWEESLIPVETVAGLNRDFDAVFSPSEFVSKALIDSGVYLPILNVGYAPPLSAFAAIVRATVGKLANVGVTFLHVSSGFPRKGIDLLLSAYASEFTASDQVRLIIKTFTNLHNETAGQVAELERRFQNIAKIELIEKDLDPTELIALFAQADVMVLPTRGEGFNVPAAEAMAAGVPLIVTGAGGHADFVSAEDTMLVPWTMEASRTHFGNSQSLWLAPDVNALAAKMREASDDVLSNSGKTANCALHARESIARNLDPKSWAYRITAGVSDLMHEPAAEPRRITVISSWDVRCGVAEYTRQLLFGFIGLPEFDATLLLLCDDRTTAQTSEMRVYPAWRLGAPNTAANLATLVSQEDPHILMIQHHPGIIQWSSLADLLVDPRLASRVVVVTLHSTLELLRIGQSEQLAVVAALHLADRVIVHTVADVNFLLRLGLTQNVVMVPQGALPAQDWPIPRQILAETSAMIGCYGFFLPLKGIDLLIAAIPNLRKLWPELRVRLVNAFYGSEESRLEIARCRLLANSLGIADCIEWHTDFLPHPESMALLHDCDLIVLSYRPTLESSSAALRSCLASGTPVAVTPNPIFDEAADAVRRLGANTPEQIAEGVTELLKDVSAREDVQEAMRNWLDERSWDKLARRTYGMVAGLAQNKFRGRREIAEYDRAGAPEQLTLYPLELI